MVVVVEVEVTRRLQLTLFHSGILGLLLQLSFSAEMAERSTSACGMARCEPYLSIVQAPGACDDGLSACSERVHHTDMQ